ncbi:MAG: Abi family protein [Bacteroidota bacterium]|nr:Abi family protein [Bacteroidota bacterium]
MSGQSDTVNHTFNPNTYFENVIERYYLDHQLRLILFDASKLIEIALRTRMIYFLAQAYGGFWYLNDAISENPIIRDWILNALKVEFERNMEIYATDFKSRHPDKDPDGWIIQKQLLLTRSQKCTKTSNINFRIRS